MSTLGTWWRENRPIVQTNKTVLQLEAQASAYQSAYNQAPWWFTKERYLSEVDARYVDLLMRMQSSTMIVSPFGATGAEPTEQDRLRAVQWSRWWALYDPIIRGAVNLWTDYGFGQDVSLNASDEKVQAVWQNFWSAPASRRVLGTRQIQKLSNSLLTDGELFVVLWNVKGLTTIRTFPTEQVTAIFTHPDDQDQVLYYERTWTTGTEQFKKYYPDWLATDAMLEQAVLPEGAIRAERENGERTCKVVSFLLNPQNRRGWPLCVASEPWAKAYKEMCQDQASVHKARAAVVEEMEVEGGDRIVASLQAQLQSGLVTNSYGYDNNPPAGAGSTRVQNRAVKTKRLALDTGAADTAQDSMLLLGQAAVGMRLPAFMLGRTDMAQNKAIADIAMRPTLRAWTRYQEGWRSYIEDIFTVVIHNAQEFGMVPEAANLTAYVNLTSAMETDFASMTTAIDAFWQRGIVEPQVLTMLALKLPEFALPQEIIEASYNRMYPTTEAEAKQTATAAMVKELQEVRLMLEMERDARKGA